ncbi:MAG TPA: hypothetical protein VMQ73_21805 [Methylomirabilota bacterium]|nr:hypothetical protein [Methylomirabilota bacterium]
MLKAILVFTALTLPLPALAGQMACSQRDDVLAQLGSKYKEAPKAAGVANNGGLIEVLTSDEGKTWTIILSMPNGTSCLLAAGEDWQSVAAVAAQGDQGPQI